jgi:hypothetical protein
MLQGKKTYIVAILMAVVNILVMLGVLTNEQAIAVNGLLAAFGLTTLRAAVGKAEIPPTTKGD